LAKKREESNEYDVPEFFYKNNVTNGFHYLKYFLKKLQMILLEDIRVVEGVYAEVNQIQMEKNTQIKRCMHTKLQIMTMSKPQSMMML
jgi:hypothetical protein